MYNTFDSPTCETIRNTSLLSSLDGLSEISGRRISNVTSNESLQVSSEGIKVFLRFKPENDSENKVENETYTIVSPTTLFTKFPNTVKKNTRYLKKFKSRENSVVSKKIKFSQIFDSQVSQEQIFDQSVKDDIDNFLCGQNVTVITYGTTNSGKTYTLFGTDLEPGIIPRCIDYIFSTVDCSGEVKFKPVNGGRVTFIDEKEQMVETAKLKAQKLDKKEDKIDKKDVGHDPEMINSLWLSLGEIYNEAVYDLLSEDAAAKDTRLKLVPDKDGNTFVKGLRIVHAASALEAQQILTAAATKLRVAASSFNQNSSRSHAIFTIKLIKHPKNCSLEDVMINSLNFYDLAGSGRLDNDSEDEQIFIESRYINKSLLALARCMKIIVENYTMKHNSEVVGPFRESCLTRFLQKCLCEKEPLVILVNINTCPLFYVETQNILGLVSSLKKFINISKDLRKLHTSVDAVSRATSNWDVSSFNYKNVEETDEYKMLREENEDLSKELTELKESMFAKEIKIRQEFADMYMQMIRDHDENWRKKLNEVDKISNEMLEDMIQKIENYYEERMDNYMRRKRRRFEFSGNQNSDGDILKDIKNSSSFQSLRDIIKKLQKDLEDAIVEKNDCKFMLTLIEKELQKLRNMKHSLENSSIHESIVDSSQEIENLFDKSENFEKLKETELQLYEKIREVEELKERLTEMEIKLAEAEGNLEKSEIAKNELEEKVALLEHISMISNGDFQIEENSNCLKENFSDDNDNDLSNETNLSFLYSKITEAGKSPKVLARISKNKFSILSNGKNRWSILDSSGSLLDNSLQSSNSSKNDSGINSEDSKSNSEAKVNINSTEIQDKVQQLKEDYIILKSQHQESTNKVLLLSEELEIIRNMMTLLQESSSINEKKLLDYEEKLLSKENEINQLKKSNKELNDKISESSNTLHFESDEKLLIFKELNERMKNQEENENRASQVLEEYLKKSISLENQLSNACVYLEKNKIKCCKEYVKKIEDLEKDVALKTSCILELEDQILKNNLNLTKIPELNEKVNLFESKLKKMQEENDNLHKTLNEKSENELCLKMELTNLANTKEDCEKEIKKLRSELAIASNKAEEQKKTDEILKPTQKMFPIKDDFFKSKIFYDALEKIVLDKLVNIGDNNNFLDNIVEEDIHYPVDESCNLSNDFLIERYKSLILKVKNKENFSLSKYIQVLDYVTKEFDIHSSDLDETLRVESHQYNPEVTRESDMSLVKPSKSNASLASSSTSSSMMTAESVEFPKRAMRSKSTCLTQ